MTVSTFAFSARTTFKRALVDEDIFLAMMGKHVKVRLNFDSVRGGFLCFSHFNVI